MRQSRLIQHIMLGVAVATLGCAGSRIPHRSNASRVPMSPPQATEQFSKAAPRVSPAPPVEPDYLPPRSEPSPQLIQPGDIPLPPSFEQDGLPAPPLNEPLSADASTSSLRRLKVPPKLQPITWKNMSQGQPDKGGDAGSATPLQSRFGHRLKPVSK